MDKQEADAQEAYEKLAEAGTYGETESKRPMEVLIAAACDAWILDSVLIHTPNIFC